MAAELADGPLRYSAVVPRLVLPVCIFCLTHFSAATCLPLQLFFGFVFLPMLQLPRPCACCVFRHFNASLMMSYL